MAYHDRGAETIAYSLDHWGLQAIALRLPERLADDEVYSSIHIIEITAM